MSNKESFLEGRELESFGYTDMPTYEQVMNSHKPTPLQEKIEKINQQILKLTNEADKLNSDLIAQRIRLYDNVDNIPENLLKAMALNTHIAYYYVRSVNPPIWTSKEWYEGEYYKKSKAIRNPFYKHGKIAHKKMEKEFYE